MDYLNEVFNIKVKYQEWKEEAKLPYMITDRYSLRIAFLNQKKSDFRLCERRCGASFYNKETFFADS